VGLAGGVARPLIAKNHFMPTLPTIESQVKFEPGRLADSDEEASPPVLGQLLSEIFETPASASGASPASRGRRLDRNTSDCGRAGGEECWARSSTPNSVASSAWQYAEPTQTLIFLDWDDTLFPCTELFERWNLPRRGPTRDLPPELERDLAKWRAAVRDYLSIVCSLSDRCVIVTNSSPPWVENCIERFAPELKPFFGRPGGPTVAYAGEVLLQARAAQSSSCCCPIWWTTVREALKPQPSYEERKAELTQAKLSAMRREATNFYSRYPGQTWKNIISLGDMKYERDAVQELSASRVANAVARTVGSDVNVKPRRERLRTKACVLPGAPSLCELTLWLRLFRLLLPSLARFDGDIDLDLHCVADPLPLLAKGLGLPHLAGVQMPQLRSSWSMAELPSGPGFYRALCHLMVDLELACGSTASGEVSAGDVAEVLEVAAGKRSLLRGRIGSPPGWVTLVSEEGHMLVEKEDEGPLEEALDEVAVAVQESMFFGGQASSPKRTPASAYASPHVLSSPGSAPRSPLLGMFLSPNRQL